MRAGPFWLPQPARRAAGARHQERQGPVPLAPALRAARVHVSRHAGALPLEPHGVRSSTCLCARSADNPVISCTRPALQDTEQVSRLTRFSLAMLEDSGWYVTSNELAEAPEYYWRVGCSINRDCNAFLKSNPNTNYVCKKQGGRHGLRCPKQQGGKAWFARDSDRQQARQLAACTVAADGLQCRRCAPLAQTRSARATTRSLETVM